MEATKKSNTNRNNSVTSSGSGSGSSSSSTSEAAAASRFISLRQSFHPEEANVSLATRKQQIAENKWGAVWVEATLVSDDDPLAPPQEVVVGDVEAANEEDISTTLSSSPSDDAKPPAKPNTIMSKPTEAMRTTPFRGGHFFDNLFGLVFTIAAVATTCGVELGAVLVYLVGVGSYKAAEYCKHKGQSCVVLLPFYGIFRLVYSVLTCIDAVLLSLSVAFAEILAYIGWLLTVCAGGYKKGSQWHQYIRNLCHLTQWAFRDFHKNWEPSRVFPFCRAPVDTDAPPEENDAEDTEDAVVA